MCHRVPSAHLSGCLILNCPMLLDFHKAALPGNISLSHDKHFLLLKERWSSNFEDGKNWKSVWKIERIGIKTRKH